MKSNQIVSLFLQRKDKFGVVGLSRKQVAWLGDQLGREFGERIFQDKRHAITVWDEDKIAYHFVIYPQGGGFIKPMPVVEKPSEDIGSKALALEAAAKLREAGHHLAADEIEKAILHA